MKGFSNMYNYYEPYPYPYYVNTPIYNAYRPYPHHYWNNTPIYNGYRTYPYPNWDNTPMYNQKQFINLKDYGPESFIINIEDVTKQNNNFRTALWTGKHLQLTLMSIDVGEDIGLEIHPNLDQFIRIEEGQGIVMMGDRKDNLDFQGRVIDNYALIIPAGKWHNLINTGTIPLKLYSIYAPPQHPRGTIHETKADELSYEDNYNQ